MKTMVFITFFCATISTMVMAQSDRSWRLNQNCSTSKVEVPIELASDRQSQFTIAAREEGSIFLKIAIRKDSLVKLSVFDSRNQLVQSKQYLGKGIYEIEIDSQENEQYRIVYETEEASKLTLLCANDTSA